MKKILLISDTHGYIDDVIIKYAKAADLVLHAGDIGDVKVIDELSKISVTKAVFGNIDSAEIRSMTKENELFEIEGFKILITHIAGKQPKYNNNVLLSILFFMIFMIVGSQFIINLFVGVVIDNF